MRLGSLCCDEDGTNDVRLCRVCRFLWSLPYCWKLCSLVRQHGRTRCPIRFSRILRKPSYVYFISSPGSRSRFHSPNRSLSTRADIERLYGERKLLAERKPLPVNVVQCLQRAAALQRNRSFSAASASSSAGVSEETAIEPEGPEFDRMSSSTSTGGIGNGTTGADTPTSMAKVTKHDLLNQYFRKDVVVWSNLDWFRYVCPSR